MCSRLLFLAILAALVASDTFNVLDHGAVGDGVTDDTDAIRKTLDLATDQGGGTLLFPQGYRFLTSPVNLTSHVGLEVNGVLLGIKDHTRYPRQPHLPSYPCSRDGCHPLRYQALLYAYKAQNISVFGMGLVDGQGSYWWGIRRSLMAGRPRLVEFEFCDGVFIGGGLTVKNPGFWTIHPVYSSNIRISDLVIDNDPKSPNSDGIDPDSCSNVLIERVNITAGDDQIAIKSGMNQPGYTFNMPCRNILVRNCNFFNGHGLSIGSEMSGGVYDVVIRDSIMYGPSKHFLNIKTSPGRRGLIANISYINMQVLTIDDGIRIDTNYDSHGTADLPTIRNISYIGISGKTKSRPGSLHCDSNNPCSGLLFQDIVFTGNSQDWDCSNVVHSSGTDVSPPLSSSCLVP